MYPTVEDFGNYQPFLFILFHINFSGDDKFSLKYSFTLENYKAKEVKMSSHCCNNLHMSRKILHEASLKQASRTHLLSTVM